MMDRYKNMPPGWHPPMARPHQDPYGPVREPLPMSLETQALLDMLMGTEKIGLDPQESWPQGQISLKQQEQFEGTVPPPGGFIGKLGKLLKPNFNKRNKPQHNLYEEADKKAKEKAKDAEDAEKGLKADFDKIKETDFTQNTKKDKDYVQKRMESMEERFDPDKTGMTSADWLDSDELVDENTAKKWLKASGISLEEFKADNPDWDGTGRQVLEYLGF